MISEMHALDNVEKDGRDPSPNSRPEAEVFFDGFEDEDLQSLLEVQEEQCTQSKIPPSSVVRAFDVESRLAEDFDPSLQFSSPQTITSRTTVDSSVSVPSTETVDWDCIHPQIPTPKKGRSSDSSHHKSTERLNAPLHSHEDQSSPTPIRPAPTQKSSWTPTPTNTSIFNPSRTCFRLSEIMEVNAATIQRQPHAVYNVFARVIYSSRENFFRKQHFQLRDLFTEAPPYLTGALLG